VPLLLQAMARPSPSRTTTPSVSASIVDRCSASDCRRAAAAARIGVMSTITPWQYAIAPSSSRTSVSCSHMQSTPPSARTIRYSASNGTCALTQATICSSTH
jgi:hypothetical protein